MSEKDLQRSFACTKCGKVHAFTGYVYAKWDTEIQHTCTCGAEHVIFQGEASLLDRWGRPAEKDN